MTTLTNTAAYFSFFGQAKFKNFDREMLCQKVLHKIKKFWQSNIKIFWRNVKKFYKNKFQKGWQSNVKNYNEMSNTLSANCQIFWKSNIKKLDNQLICIKQLNDKMFIKLYNQMQEIRQSNVKKCNTKILTAKC